MKKKQDCMKVAGDMFFNTPMNKLPEPALEFAKFMCSKVGMCGEVLLTAYAYYCQMVLGLECKDDLYQIPKDPNNQWTKWFIDRSYNKIKIK